jgi:hypothetical protein
VAKGERCAKNVKRAAEMNPQPMRWVV